MKDDLHSISGVLIIISIIIIAKGAFSLDTTEIIVGVICLCVFLFISLCTSDEDYNNNSDGL